MASISKTYSSQAAPGAASAVLFVRPGDAFTWSSVGTIDDLVEVALQIEDGLGAWRDVKRWTAGSVSDSGSVLNDSQAAQRFRFVADVPTTDPATVLTSFAVSATESTGTMSETRNPEGTTVFRITDDGIETPKATIGTVVVEQGSVSLSAGSVQHNNGTAAGAIATGFGKNSAEGAKIVIIEETISFVDNAALYKAMTTPIPAGAVIMSVQANIESALTGGGTTVKVGLGPNATDPDKYGKTSVLTKNAKISTVPDWAVLAAQEAIDVCACATNGAAGNTALTVGSVRVRVVYLSLANLADA